jgi:hypothetical protein
MAEIRVEPTAGRSRAWLWLLILLALIAGLVYWLYASGNLRLGSTRSDTTSAAPTAPARSGT